MRNTVRLVNGWQVLPHPQQALCQLPWVAYLFEIKGFFDASPWCRGKSR
jgi:hypothetical protein